MNIVLYVHFDSGKFDWRTWNALRNAWYVKLKHLWKAINRWRLKIDETFFLILQRILMKGTNIFLVHDSRGNLATVGTYQIGGDDRLRLYFIRILRSSFFCCACQNLKAKRRSKLNSATIDAQICLCRLKCVASTRGHLYSFNELFEFYIPT